MFHSRLMHKAGVWTLAIWILSSPLSAQRSRIPPVVDNSSRVTLTDNVAPQASAANDLGPVDPSLVLSSVQIELRPSAEQQADLQQLLKDQQDPASPLYRQWLTPEEYAQRFGASQQDLDAIAAWAATQNLTESGTARSRTSLSLKGTAADVERAFGTQIHGYTVRGRQRFGNATPPTIPAAFGGIVLAIRGLNNFRLEPRSTAVLPEYNSSSGRHYFAPDDFTLIYNVAPLYAAGFDGSGQKLAVVGQTQIDLSDLRQFRTRFQLPGADPQIVLVPLLRDPGISPDDLPEADLDLEWASAVARKADLIYVYSDSVDDAVQYAIDQNLAPVISMSYGLCESLAGQYLLGTWQRWAQQANAQGITWVNASGDSGGADCSRSGSLYGGLAVDAPASIPEVTGIGGTQLDDSAGTYWAGQNSASGSSALSYIPEVVWNDGDLNDPSAGGGGASVFFSKPSWQLGAGVPDDGARDVPDVSLSASPSNVAYLVQTGGSLKAYGGTSAGTPAFAGYLAVLNQYFVSTGAQATNRLGNVNPTLYTLAQTNPEAYHDITIGNNIASQSCSGRGRSCTSGSFGYTAAPGYDLATGLGTIDGSALANAWKALSSRAARAPATVSLTPASPLLDISGTTQVTAKVTGTGSAPQGTVTLYASGVALGSVQISGSGSVSNATFTIRGAQFALGTTNITAKYGGDGNYGSASATATLTATGSSGGPPTISGLSNGASFQQSFAPGMILSIFGTGLAPATWSADAVPLATQMAGVSVTIGGIAAPLYYVSPTQLNVQIPYELSAGGLVALSLNNNGQRTSTSLTLATTAPGIFMDLNSAPVPNTTASAGQSITLFITGDGLTSPVLPTGSAPNANLAASALPKPLQSVTVTVGNLPATIEFVGIGPGLVGVTQINYRVPDGIAQGSQPVVVTVGGVASQTASLLIP